MNISQINLIVDRNISVEIQHQTYAVFSNKYVADRNTSIETQRWLFSRSFDSYLRENLPEIFIII